MSQCLKVAKTARVATMKRAWRHPIALVILMLFVILLVLAMLALERSTQKRLRMPVLDKGCVLEVSNMQEIIEAMKVWQGTKYHPGQQFQMNRYISQF